MFLGTGGNGIQVHQSFVAMARRRCCELSQSNRCLGPSLRVGIIDRLTTDFDRYSIQYPGRVERSASERRSVQGPEATSRQVVCYNCCLNWSAKISSSHPFDSSAPKLASRCSREPMSNSESSNQQFNCRCEWPPPLFLEKSISVPAPNCKAS